VLPNDNVGANDNVNDNNNQNINQNNNNNNRRVQLNFNSQFKLMMAKNSHAKYINNKFVNNVLGDIKYYSLQTEEQFEKAVKYGKLNKTFVPSPYVLNSKDDKGALIETICKTLIYKNINKRVFYRNDEEAYYSNSRRVVEIGKPMVAFDNLMTTYVDTGINSELTTNAINCLNYENNKNYGFNTVNFTEKDQITNLPNEEPYVNDRDLDLVLINYGEEFQTFTKEEIYRHAMNVSPGVYACGIYHYVKKAGDVNIAGQTIGHFTSILDTEEDYVMYNSEDGVRKYKYIDNDMLLTSAYFITGEDDYILKVIPISKIPTTNGYLIAFKIVKYEEIDKLMFADIDNQHYQAIINLFNKINNELSHEETMAIYKEIFEVYAEAKDDIKKKLKEITQEQEKENPIIEVPETKIKITKEQNGTIVLSKDCSGRIFNYLDKLTFSNIIPDTTAISKKIINKVTMMLLNAPQIDQTIIKGAINFVLREHPELSIAEEIIPAVAYIIQDTRLIESQITFFISSTELKQINALKTCKYQITPQNLKQAWQAGAIFKYLLNKCRDWFFINNTTSVEPDINRDYKALTQDFTRGQTKH
jgi:hypothetical protein